MNRNLRLKIEEAIEHRTISKNLIYLCMAYLYNKIHFSNSDTIKQKEQFKSLAQCAKDNGITKEELYKNIKDISSSDYPTLKAINRVYDIVASEDYEFVKDDIPDSLIHQKTEEEREEQRQKEAIKKAKSQQPQEEDSEDFRKLCEYVQDHIIYCYPLYKSMEQQLRKMKTEKYDYSFLEKVFYFNRKTIVDAADSKHFDSKIDRFDYMCRVARNLYSKTEEYIAEQKEQERIMDERRKYTDWSSWIPNPNAQYVSREKEHSETFKRLIEDMW